VIEDGALAIAADKIVAVGKREAIAPIGQGERDYRRAAFRRDARLHRWPHPHHRRSADARLSARRARRYLVGKAAALGHPDLSVRRPQRTNGLRRNARRLP
jgi:hypothetical protein